MLERLGLSAARDYSTLEWLGNTGSVALPITMALGIGADRVKAGDKIAMLGIGSGINVVMLGLEW
jgi:3-oxoacyl-[acyl-carrier-protein] synthase III